MERAELEGVRDEVEDALAAMQQALAVEAAAAAAAAAVEQQQQQQAMPGGVTRQLVATEREWQPATAVVRPKRRMHRLEGVQEFGL